MEYAKLMRGMKFVLLVFQSKLDCSVHAGISQAAEHAELGGRNLRNRIGGIVRPHRRLDRDWQRRSRIL